MKIRERRNSSGQNDNESWSSSSKSLVLLLILKNYYEAFSLVPKCGQSPTPLQIMALFLIYLDKNRNLIEKWVKLANRPSDFAMLRLGTWVIETLGRTSLGLNVVTCERRDIWSRICISPSLILKNTSKCHILTYNAK